MNYTIRKYKDSDFEMLSNWWASQEEPVPTKELIPMESTFVMELEGEPILSIALFFPNVKGMCYFENFVGNPSKKSELRKKCSDILIHYGLGYAKAAGYKRIVCFAYKEKVKKRYEALGMTKVCDNVSLFAREL